jgi:predicted hotdog family 3-hydroxylacyl-ACP dehydratase
VHVLGFGVWTGSGEPKAALIPPKLARRATFLSRMAAEVMEQAAAGKDLSKVRTVHASASGEVRTLEALLDMLYDDGVLSPARFHNSVHNTAAGHLSIATGNRAFSTTISAGADTVAMGLLEAMALLQDGGEDVLVIFADEAPGPFGLPPFQPLAVALLLSANAQGSLASLGPPRRAAGVWQPPAEVAHNPVAKALALIEAVQARRSGAVPLGGWAVDLKQRYPPVSELLPHQAPMILIDEVLEVHDKSLTARVRLTPESPFMEQGRLPALITLEYMAQSIAALAGTRSRAKGEPVKLGLLMSCREMQLEVETLAAGDELTVFVSEVWSDENVGNFDCFVRRGDEMISKASLSVYQGDLVVEKAG